jgi:hypothetical protein
MGGIKMNRSAYSSSTFLQVYYHHWLAFWKPLMGIILLLVLGVGGFWVWLPLGIILFVSAIIWGISLWLYRSWHTFSFTADHRLKHQRGFLGSSQDVITLFGVITPYQMPILGRWLDMGSIRLNIPNSDIHIRHIANFNAFRTQLLRSRTQQQERRSVQPVQVVIQMPSVAYVYDGVSNRVFAAKDLEAISPPSSTESMVIPHRLLLAKQQNPDDR